MHNDPRTDLKPIETRFKGYRFRSRLEARWAVFFDCCRQHFLYEDQGFKLKSGSYLPDFFFPKYKAFVEVKPLDQLPMRNFEFGIGGWVLIDDVFPREINLAWELSRGMALQPGHFVICYGDPWDVIFDGSSISMPHKNGPHMEGIGFIDLFPADLLTAADAARSARFEHGEQHGKLPVAIMDRGSDVIPPRPWLLDNPYDLPDDLLRVLRRFKI